MLSETDAQVGPSADWSTRRLEIWEHLGDIFTREGFRQLTVGDLAERLRCSRRTLYSLAASRDELVLGVVEHLLAARADAARERAHATASTVEAVVARIAAGSLSLARSSAFFADLTSTLATQRAYAAYRRDEHRALVDLLSDGMAQGEITPCDPELVADVLEAAAERIATRRRYDDEDLDAATEVLTSLVSGWLAVR